MAMLKARMLSRQHWGDGGDVAKAKGRSLLPVAPVEGSGRSGNVDRSGLAGEERLDEGDRPGQRDGSGGEAGGKDAGESDDNDENGESPGQRTPAPPGRRRRRFLRFRAKGRASAGVTALFSVTVAAAPG